MAAARSPTPLIHPDPPGWSVAACGHHSLASPHGPRPQVPPSAAAPCSLPVLTPRAPQVSRESVAPHCELSRVVLVAPSSIFAFFVYWTWIFFPSHLRTRVPVTSAGVTCVLG